MIRKLASGTSRLYSRKNDPTTGRRKNLGTFPSREAVEKHELAIHGAPMPLERCPLRA
jgi:hypothetical protein